MLLHFGALCNIFAVRFFDRGPLDELHGLSPHFPEVFSQEGIATIGMWGLLYLAAAQSLGGPQPQPWLFLVLLAHCLFYFGTWVNWTLYTNAEYNLATLLRTQPIAGVFFGGYGVYSLFFAAIFLVCAVMSFLRDEKLSKKRDERLLKKDMLREFYSSGASARTGAGAGAGAGAGVGGDVVQRRPALRRALLVEHAED